MSPVETVQKIHAAFGKGDVATILDSVDENVDWSLPEKECAA